MIRSSVYPLSLSFAGKLTLLAILHLSVILSAGAFSSVADGKKKHFSSTRSLLSGSSISFRLCSIYTRYPASLPETPLPICLLYLGDGVKHSSMVGGRSLFKSFVYVRMYVNSPTVLRRQTNGWENTSLLAAEFVKYVSPIFHSLAVAQSLS